MKTLLAFGIAGVLAGGFAFPAFAQTSSAQKEISTAHAHALLAQSATTLNMVHTHLHHVINCLVGSSGQGYDAAAGTPCKGEGNGAIPDSAADSALHGKLESALSDAQSGLASTSLAAAQDDAGKAAAALQSTPAQKKSGAYKW